MKKSVGGKVLKTSILLKIVYFNVLKKSPRTEFLITCALNYWRNGLAFVALAVLEGHGKPGYDDDAEHG